MPGLSIVTNTILGEAQGPTLLRQEYIHTEDGTRHKDGTTLYKPRLSTQCQAPGCTTWYGNTAGPSLVRVKITISVLMEVTGTG